MYHLISIDRDETFSGDYNDLTNKPTIPSISGLASESYVNEYVQNAIKDIPKEEVDLSEYAKKTELHQLINDNIIETQNTWSSKKINDSLLSKNMGAENVGKMLVVGSDGNIIVMDVPEGGGGNPNADITGTVDTSNNIILSGDIPNGVYSLKYENYDGTYTEIGDLVVGDIMTYAITQNFTNISSDYNNASIIEGGKVTIKLIPNKGYILGEVKVVMGGIDITSSVYSNGKIAIPSVTGNVIITVSTSGYTNLAEYNATNTSDFTIWCNDSRLGSDGSYRQLLGYATTNYIEVKKGDVIRVKGFDYETQIYPTMCVMDSSKTKLYNSYYLEMLKSNGFISDLTESESYAEFTIGSANIGDNIAYIRIAGKPTNGGENVIITKNEEII